MKALSCQADNFNAVSSVTRLSVVLPLNEKMVEKNPKSIINCDAIFAKLSGIIVEYFSSTYAASFWTFLDDFHTSYKVFNTYTGT
jgi:hypothetical protein